MAVGSVGWRTVFVILGRPEPVNVYDSLAAAVLKQAVAQQEADEYEMRVQRFLEHAKGDDDYEEKVKKFLDETSRRWAAHD